MQTENGSVCGELTKVPVMVYNIEILLEEIGTIQNSAIFMWIVTDIVGHSDGK